MTKTTTGIPPHYKQTQLGLIPVEWEVTELGKIGKVISGLTYSPDDVDDIGTLVLRSSNIQNESLSFEDNVYVNTEKLQYNPVKEGDVLICVRNGSKNLIGKNTLITKEVEGVAFGAFMTVYRSEFNSFLIHYFKTDFYKREIHKNLGATINSINGSELKKFKVPLPSLPEQQKIAAILSTWDRAIAKQQELIAAKQQFKKGLMQRLLTGQQRFDGFEGEWEEVRLGELGIVQTGNTPSKKNQDLWGGEFYWSTAEDMDEKYINDTNQKLTLKGKTKARIAKRGSVLVTCIASIGKNSIANVDTGFNQQINAISTNEYFDNEFVYYLLDFHPKKLLQFAGAGAMPMLNKNTFMSIKFRFPKIEEQQKIASVLSAADQEIALLQKQLTQLQTQKRGLMQGLLTGAVRVKI